MIERQAGKEPAMACRDMFGLKMPDPSLILRSRRRLRVGVPPIGLCRGLSSIAPVTWMMARLAELIEPIVMVAP